MSAMADSHGKRARTRRTLRGGGRADRGFTFVEVVVTVALMAIVVAPILSAVGVAVRESSRSRSSAQVETAVVNAADRVNRAPKTCDYTVYVQAAVQSQGWSADRAVAYHERYVPAATPNLPGTWVEGACEISAPTPLLVQRITITVISPDGSVRRSIQVVKSDV
jgi:prepilin-type N-terminal cleavage/methylation domain-containing protein